MLDAILRAHAALAARRPREVWIGWCDQVALRRATLRRLAAVRSATAADPAADRRRRRAVHPSRARRGRPDRSRPPAARRRRDARGRRERHRAVRALGATLLGRMLPQFAAEDTGAGARHRRAQLPAVPRLAGAAAATSARSPARTSRDDRRQHARRPRAPVRATLDGRVRADHAVDRHSRPTTRSASSARCSSGSRPSISPTLGVTREIIVVDDGSRDGTAEIASGVAGVRVCASGRTAARARPCGAASRVATGDVRDHPGRRPRVRPARLPADAAALLRRGGVDVGLRQPLPERPGLGACRLRLGRSTGQRWAAYLGGRSLSLRRLAATGAVSSPTRSPRSSCFRATWSCALPLETTRLRARSRDHGQGPRPGAPDRRGPRSATTRAAKAEGKKIGARDWWRALRTFWRYRQRLAVRTGQAALRPPTIDGT